MRISPLFWVLASLISGLLLSKSLALTSLAYPVWVLALICFALLLFFPKTRNLALLIGFSVLAAYGHSYRLESRAGILQSIPLFEEGIYKLELQDIKGQSPTFGRRLIFDVHTQYGVFKAQGYLRDSTLIPGQLLWAQAKLLPIKGPKTPDSFNFRDYAHRQDILADIRISDWQAVESPTLSYLQLIRQIPQSAHRAFISYGIDQRQAGFLVALLYGNRAYLNPELRSSYQDVGLAHIMAISGLHVGIVFGLLLLFTSFLNPKYALLLRLLGLLLYCVLVGASPSVLRASLMAAFVAFGLYRNQKGTLINSLLASAIVLLFLDGELLFETGFQLSYLAVFSIATFLPPIQKLYQVNTPVLKHLWNLLALTLAVQMGTLPLVIHLFNQFSLLFLPGNLLLIPLMGFLLISGYFISLTTLLDIDLGPIYAYYDFAVASINNLVSGMSSQNDLIWADLKLALPLTLLITAFSFNIGCFLNHRNRWLTIMSTLVLVQLFMISDGYSKPHLRLIPANDEIVIELQQKPYAPINSYCLESEEVGISLADKIIIRNPDWEMTEIHEMQNMVALVNNQWTLPGSDMDLEMVVLEGYHSLTSREKWTKWCEQNKVPFHDLYYDGYLSIKLPL